MYDFFSSRFGMFLLTTFFAGSVVYMGVHDLHRRYGRMQIRRDVRSDRMVRDLYGSVDVVKRGNERRELRDDASRRREEEWPVVKSFARGLLP
jgi:hypothetical protein